MCPSCRLYNSRNPETLVSLTDLVSSVVCNAGVGIFLPVCPDEAKRASLLGTDGHLTQGTVVDHFLQCSQEELKNQKNGGGRGGEGRGGERREFDGRGGMEEFETLPLHCNSI